jgi:hypothetical protein
MAADATNPLLSPQREKKGSDTAADYAYQYHWALYRAIQEQGLQKEYAVFVELHEDVVVCDSLDQSKAKFQFNQVKTTKRNFTATELLRKKNGSSVLGKLIGSSTGKPFSKDINELTLVAVAGFGLKLKKPGLKLNKITLPDIDDKEIDTIALAIKNELNVDPLPKALQFLIPELPDKTFQQFVIAEIAKLISALYPASSYNPVDIYRILIDELNRKGEVTYDFSKWTDLISNKALTSITVTKVINQYTNLKDEVKVLAEFTAITTELGLNVMRAKNLKKNFDRYRQSRLGNKTVSQLDTTNAIKLLITSNTAAANNDIKILIENVFNSLDKKVKSNFASDEDVKAAIICEYIMEDS